MKLLSLFGLLALLSGTALHARDEILGYTRSCPVRAKVVRVTTPTEDLVLLISRRKVHRLAFQKQVEGIRYYFSQESSFPPQTFIASIMSEEMSRLSELEVYYSGVMVSCLIER